MISATCVIQKFSMISSINVLRYFVWFACQFGTHLCYAFVNDRCSEFSKLDWCLDLVRPSYILSYSNTELLHFILVILLSFVTSVLEKNSVTDSAVVQVRSLFEISMFSQ